MPVKMYVRTNRIPQYCYKISIKKNLQKILNNRNHENAVTQNEIPRMRESFSIRRAWGSSDKSR